MPLFEYKCNVCKKEFELLVSSSTVPECPSCQGKDLTKKFSVFAVSMANGCPNKSLDNPNCHTGNCSKFT